MLAMNTFTNVTDSPRVRAQLDIKVSRGIINIFDFGLSILESYDTRPPTTDAAEDDPSLVTTLGYSFEARYFVKRPIQSSTVSCQKTLLRAFSTQWFSSGKWTNFDGTPRRCRAVNTDIPSVSTRR